VNVFRLTGAAVNERVYQKVTFLAYRFSPLVNGYKSINAYHAGDGVWVEVDILLDEKCPLEVAHDIAETLQYCCEGLPEVDRAFITCDYTIGAYRACVGEFSVEC
jgi:divalent metal cation (Fe/Co/Zn/Cd) transporter